MNKGALVQWSTPRLENAGGAWEGTRSGVFCTDRGDIIAVWCDQPEQPRVLVRLWVHREQPGPLDVDPGEDLVQRLLAKPVRDRRVSPERS